EFTEESLVEEIAQAELATIAAEETGPCAKSVEYNADKDLIEIHLKNGSIFSVPPRLVQGLGSATPEQLNDVWIDRAGLSVHWESLDVDFSILGLIQGIFGTKSWMAELGRKCFSEAKSLAVRENGKKGGRPREVKLPVS
ncbi:MAG: DUF2442 domain-containing protein, partial [Microcystaceae cyanobacterium]